MIDKSHHPPFCNFDYINSSENGHDDFTERLRKSLYYGKLPGTERPSLPLTDMAVEFFQEAAPRKLGCLDTYFASSSSRSACMTPTSMIVGMMYVRRLRRRQPEYLTQISSSELFLISMMMASKFLYDEGIDEEVFNDEWANSGDLETEDVNELERDFLSAIDWHLFVGQEEFSAMLDTVEKRIALSQGLQRGWFSYTDLCILSKDLRFMNWNDLAAELSKIMSVGSLAYLAGILTLIGSTVLGTTASTALVSAGGALWSIRLDTPHTVIPRPDLGSLSTSEILSLDRTNLSGQELGSVPDVNVLGLQNDNTDAILHTETGARLGEEPGPVTKDHPAFFNGFLSPFLALVTLKDTLIKFAYAIAEEKRTTEDDHINESQEICSDGPCLMDSWPNCWNVSSEFDWSKFKSSHANHHHGPSNRYSGVRTALKHQQLVQSKYCMRKDNVRSDPHHVSRISGVHCCCKWPWNLDIPSNLDRRLSDLAHGFMTSAVLVT